MSFFELAFNECKEMTPVSGFNICVYDSMSPLGENLDLIDWRATRQEAELRVAELQAKGATAYLFGNDEIGEVAVEETVAIPSSLSNVKIGGSKRVDETTATVIDENYTATGASVDEEPSMHNEYGFNVKKAVPEWQYDIESYHPQIQEAKVDPEKKRKSWMEKLAPWLALIGGAAGLDYIMQGEKLQLMARYVYHGHEYPEICEGFNGDIFDLTDKTHRPVPPSEGLGYTTTHPNCKCTWEMIMTKRKPAKLTRSENTHVKGVRKHIHSAAKAGDLHTVRDDGSLSPRVRSSDPLKMIRESIMELRGEIPWMTEDYLDKLETLKAMTPNGRFMLIRAATEAITDHRPEGDDYRRLLAGDELHAMARTGIGKAADINHHPEFVTDTIVLDGDYNKELK